MTELQALVEEVAPEAVALRRDLHMHPELGFEEVRTSGIVADRLRELGLEVRTGIGRTGVVGVLDTGRPGRTVLARADMDALPVHEQRDSPYRSTVDGKMHACGHDGHTAVLLAVAEILVRRSDRLHGKVLFVFQPAEEIVAGAAAMLEDGVLQGVRVDAAIGLHLSSNHRTGTVAVSPGPSMAATDSFLVRLSGRGGHAGFPHQTVDTVVLAAHAITGLQTLVSRETSPLDQAVISVASVNGGNSHNVLPDSVELKGTMRTFTDAVRERLRQRLPEFLSGLAGTFGGASELKWVSGAPALINDPEKTATFREVAAATVGADNVLDLEPVMGAEDMSLWLRAAPGTFFWVGARNESIKADKPHHHPEFDIDEAAIPLAITLLARGVERFLQD